MLTDNLTNKHKLSSETYSTKNSTKVTLYSSKKVQVPKDPLNISYSRPKKKTFNKFVFRFKMRSISFSV